MTLEGRVAFVTGGTKGIGEAIVRQMVQCGSRVMFTGRNAEKAAQLETDLGGKAVAHLVDMTQPDQVEASIKGCVERLGALDILVNNAGITRDGLLIRMKEEDWDQVLTTNLKAAFLTCKFAFKALSKSAAGRIINITSVIGLTGNAGQVNYAASKSGLIGLTKSVAKEYASRGITANAVAPGFIETDMTSALKLELQEDIRKQILLGRFGHANEVASLVTFLASDAAAYITGQVITIDGGLSV